MKDISVISLAIIFFILFKLSACQKFERIKVTYTNSQLVFNFEELGKEAKGDMQFILYEISVSRLNCSENCVLWEMVRDEKYFNTNDYPLEHSQITYGANAQAMTSKTRPATLTAGQYSVVANVALVIDNKFEKAQRLFQAFELSGTVANQLSLKIIDD